MKNCLRLLSYLAALVSLLLAVSCATSERPSYTNDSTVPKQADIDANATARYGSTLILASLNGDEEKVRALLKAKVDVNAKDPWVGTALTATAFVGNLEMVRLLLAAGADVNARSRSGATALILASDTGNLEVVRALLDAKADVNAKRNDGHTALSLALENGHREIAQLLRSR